MMFICSECGKKYEIMPEFCDCGNDIFEEETDKKIAAQENFSNDFNEINTQNIKRNNVEKISPISIILFILCIILSFFVLFFIGNPVKNEAKLDNNSKKEITNTDIPAIDSFWDSSLAKNKQIIEPKEEVKENKITEVLPSRVKDIIPVAKTEKTKTPEKKKEITNPKPVTKNTSTQIKSSTLNSTSSNQSQKQLQTVDNSTKDLTNRVKSSIKYNNTSSTQLTQQPSLIQKQPVSTSTQKQSTNTTTTTGNVQTQTQQISSSQPQTTTSHQTQTPQIVKSQAQLKTELNNYKMSLRNTIGNKIDFTKVIGDGDCQLSFKINSNGKLISKSFVKQSSNITLNDAAYKAIMGVSSFNPPPEGYSGENLYLKIRFYNGNFEITLN